MPVPALLKVAAVAAKNPKRIKKGIIVICSIIMGIVILPIIILMTISSLMGEDSNINDSFDIYNSNIYKETYLIYIDFINKTAEEMEQTQKEIEEENTEKDEEGNEYCTVDVDVIVNQTSMSTLLAYITIFNNENTEVKDYHVTSSQILSFYNQICQIDISQSGDHYTIQNIFLTKEETAGLFFDQSDSNRGLFLVSADNFESLLESSAIGSGDLGDFVGDVTFDESIGGRAAAEAVSKVGCEYSQSNRFGSNSYDCSSLVYRVYKPFGVDVSYHGSTTAAEEARGIVERGLQIGVEQLQPGDVLFWRTNDGIRNKRWQGIGHTAIYVGEGMMVEAKGKKWGVVYSPVYTKNLIVCGRPYGK